jgi:hypothetical protein
MTVPFELEANPLHGADQLGIGLREVGAEEAEAGYGYRARPRWAARSAKIAPRALSLPPAAPMRMRWPIRPGTIILPPWSEWRSIGEPTSDNSRIESPGERVHRLQFCLNRALGLRLRVTGKMDAATRSAVRSFQKKHGLPVDGVVNPSTESILRATCAAAPEFELATGATARTTNPKKAGPCGCAGNGERKVRPCSCHDKQPKPVRRRRLGGALEPWRVQGEW